MLWRFWCSGLHPFADLSMIHSQTPWPELVHGTETDLLSVTKSGHRSSNTTKDTGVKTEEWIIDILLPRASLELSAKARDVLALLWELMNLVCSVPNLDFLNFDKKREVNYRESLVEAVDQMQTDPSYKIGRVREDWKLSRDVFSVDDMKAMVCFCR